MLRSSIGILVALCVVLPVSLAFGRGAGEDAYLVAAGKTVAKLGAADHADPIHYDCIARRIYRFDYPQMICTDFAGKVLWKYKLRMQRGQWVRAVFDGDPHVVCVWTGHEFTGLDKMTGRLRYQVDPGNPYWTRTRGGAVYFVGHASSDQVRRFNPGTGKVVWSAEPVPGKANWCPIRRLGDGFVQGLDLRHHYFDRATGKPLPMVFPASKTRRVVVAADRIFHLSKDRLIAYPRAGGDPLWSMKRPDGADRLLEPFAHGRLIVAGKKLAHIFDCANKRVLFTIPIEQKYVLPEMRQTRDRVLVHNQTSIRCIDAVTGALRWRTPRVRICEMQSGPKGTVLRIVWNKIRPRNRPERTEGIVFAHRISDGKVLWKWTAPPFANPHYLFAGIAAEECRGRLLLRVKWHLLD